MQTILIIEDNNDVRDNLAEILELANYSTLSAENGKMGVALAKEHAPDLILCDVMMPELDGYGTLKIIKSIDKLKHIPFIFLTAKTDKDDFRKGMGLGATDYITKPFDDTDLLDSIEMRLKLKQEMSIPESPVGKPFLFNEEQARQDIIKLCENKEIRHYPAKANIFADAYSRNCVYYIISGLVKAYMTNHFGKSFISKIVGVDSLVGLNISIHSSNFAKSVKAIEDSQVVFIPYEEFAHELLQNPNLNQYVLELIATENHTLSEKLMYMAFSSVQEKVAYTLCSLSESLGSTTLRLTRDDLAAFAGMSRETFIRTLSGLKSEGYVDVKIHDVTILDRESLRDIYTA